MKSFDDIDELWTEYCASSIFHLGGDVTLYYNPSEPELKIELKNKYGEFINMSRDDFRRLTNAGMLLLRESSEEKA